MLLLSRVNDNYTMILLDPLHL